MRYTVLYMMLLMVGVISARAQHQSFNYKVHFKSDEFILDQTDQTLLNQLVASIPKDDYYEITLTAHTDSDADLGYNEALSAKRAASVREYLQKKGVPHNKFYVKCYGERAPLGNNKADEGKSANRRVEVTLHHYRFNNTADMLKAAGGNQHQKFTINPLQENIITGKDGVRIVIPAASLVDKNGKAVTSTVTIELSEYLKPADALYQSLSTQTSDGRMLETGGMFKIEAFAAGEAIQLKQGASLKADIPAMQPKNDMLVFNASVNKQGITTWETNGTGFAVSGGRSGTDLLMNATRDYSRANFNFAAPKPPLEPTAPMAPVLSVNPTEATLFTKWQRLFLSKKAKQVRLIKAQNIAERQNVQTLGEYRKRLIAHERKMKNYAIAIAAYEEANGTRFKEWVDEQIAIQQSVIKAIVDSRKSPEKLGNIEKMLEGYDVPYLSQLLPTTAEEEQYNRLLAKHSVVLYELQKLKQAGVTKSAQTYGHRGMIRLFNRRGKSYPYDYVMNMKQSSAVEVKDAVSLDSLVDQTLSADANAVMENIELKVSYSAYLTSFGTINCDRFYKVPQNRMAGVSVALNKSAQVVFYIPEQKSYLYATYDGKSYTVKLPRGAKYTLFVMADDNRTPMFFSQQGSVSNEEETIVPQMKQATLAEVKEKFEAL